MINGMGSFFMRRNLVWLLLPAWIFLAACSQAAVPAAAPVLEPVPTVYQALTPSASSEPPLPTATASGPEADSPEDAGPDDTAVLSPEATVPAAEQMPTPSPLPPFPPTGDPSGRTRNMISARLDYDQHVVQVWQTIEYVNHTPVSLSELMLVVEPNREPGVFRLEEIVGHDGEAMENSDLDGARLTIPLAAELPSGSAVSLGLSYELVLPDVRESFGYTSRQTNLGDWYAFVPPYDPQEGWLVYEPGVVGEHLAYETQDFEVEFELVGRQDDLIVAASAQPQSDGNPYHYYLEGARNFSLSISPEYQVRREQVGEVTVLSFFFPETAMSADVALQATVDALNIFSEIYQPYPFDSLTVVPADFKDGMEYSGLYFLDQKLYRNYNGTYRSFLISIAAHETAHQWWYGIVANDQALEPWLDESFATYSELLFYERFFPEHVEWWWRRRVQRFEPAGFVDTTIYDHDGFRSYVDAVYLNGALFLQEVRDQVGDEAFRGLLQNLQHVGINELITAEDFWDLLGQQGGIEVDEIRKGYFSE